MFGCRTYWCPRVGGKTKFYFHFFILALGLFDQELSYVLRLSKSIHSMFIFFM